MATYREALEKANKLTRRKGKETSATKLLMLHFSGLEPTDLYLHYETEMPEDRYHQYFEALSEYIDHGKPVQQIIGYVYFYGHRFLVDERALIPRFETEELVANVLMLYDELFENKNVKLVDIGTGSGCLAITLKKEEPEHMDVIATDISEEAITLAKENAEHLNATVDFRVGDMLEPVLEETFDILVSNPPYIPTDEAVDRMIIDNEPNIALFGGDDGLKFYRIILENAAKILKPKSLIAFEHGYDKGDALRTMANQYFPQAKIYTLKDMQKLDRMTFIINGFEGD